MSTNTSSYTICSAPNVYIFVYILIETHIAPLKLAERRTLTLFGKVCIIKLLALSKILYTASCLTVPDKIIKKIDTRIFRVLWGKRNRIKRKSVVNKLERGGLNMVNVQAQISAI